MKCARKPLSRTRKRVAAKNLHSAGVAASASAANVCFDDVQQQLLHQRSAAAAFLHKDDAYRVCVRVCVCFTPTFAPSGQNAAHTTYLEAKQRSHKVQILRTIQLLEG